MPIGGYDVLARRARVDPDRPGNALHEYVHHLQATLPGFQTIFRQEHLRRTTLPDGARRPLAEMAQYDAMHRSPNPAYLDEYMGKHYDPKAVAHSDAKLPDAEGLEVPSRGYQMLFDLVPTAHGDQDFLVDLAYADPGMLDLLIGVLFRYDPPGPY